MTSRGDGRRHRAPARDAQSAHHSNPGVVSQRALSSVSSNPLPRGIWWWSCQKYRCCFMRQFSLAFDVCMCKLPRAFCGREGSSGRLYRFPVQSASISTALWPKFRIPIRDIVCVCVLDYFSVLSVFCFFRGPSPGSFLFVMDAWNAIASLLARTDFVVRPVTVKP
jgi:hypothetical protein